jgi:hypothetical protein
MGDIPTLQEIANLPPEQPHRHSGREMLDYGGGCPICLRKQMEGMIDPKNVCELSLCEIDQLVLQTDRYYRFVETEGCKDCAEYATRKLLRMKELEAGLDNRENVALRVKWANTLRAIVAKRCPVNKMGSPLVTDVDLLLATDEERLEALNKIKETK